MVRIIGNNLKLTRKQVTAALVNPDPQVVKQFESLFRQQNGQSPNYGWRTVDADTGIFDGDYLLDVDATAAPVEITLPPAAQAEGRQFVAKLVDASGNGLTLTPDGSETIDGAASLVLTAQWASATILSNGTAWRIVASV